MADQARPGWIDIARDRIARDGAVVRASLVGVRGSAPREAGATMLITRQDIWQTIGGGSLEFEVMRRARMMLAEATGPWPRQVIRAALGPDMGQCCGGQVRVLLEYFGPEQESALAALAGCRAVLHPLDGDQPPSDAGDDAAGMDRASNGFVAPVAVPGRPVFLYGAGHIGRALAPHLVALQLDLHWVDVMAERFPAAIPDGARRVVAADPTVIASHAPVDSLHLV
ncbi:MAG: XdhC family protein, partial [Candidatus Puniceispirillaceae bacterium]